MAIISNVPVLIFGETQNAYGVARALASEEIPLYLVTKSRSSYLHKSRLFQKTWAIGADENDFIDQMHRIAEEIASPIVIMVCNDLYLDRLSKSCETLPESFILTFKNWETVKLVRDKHKTYELCDAAGIGYPKSICIGSEMELNDFIAAKTFSYPFLLKSNLPEAYKYPKGLVAHNDDELREIYNKNDGYGGGLLISEYIPGDARKLYNMLIVADENGDPIEVFMNRKSRSIRPFAVCTLMESMYDEDLLQTGLKLVKSLRYLGYSNPEFKLDPRDNTLKLMEVNGRISLSNSHALTAGLNLPLAMYRHAIGLSPERKACQPEPKTTYWWTPVQEFRVCLRYPSYFFSYFLTFFKRPVICEPFYRKDKLTGLRCINKSIVSFLSKLRKRRSGTMCDANVDNDEINE